MVWSMSTSSETKSEALFRRLRADVLNGHLTPGSRLGFADLNVRYGASTGVLREVLPRLVEQGLVTSQSQLGYRVMTLSVQELQHLTEARMVVESEVLRQSITYGSLEWESAVVAAHHRLSQLSLRAQDDEISAEWLKAHRDFHATILSGCPNTQLQDIVGRLRAVSEVYQCWSIRTTSNRRERDHEHDVIAKLCVAREIEPACQALSEHIQTTASLLLSSDVIQDAEAMSESDVLTS